MKTITAAELSALEEGAAVWARRNGQPKVFRGKDGLVYKLVKSKLHWKPSGPVRCARRFAHNARRLASRGIACPEIVRVLHVAGEDRDLIVYKPLEGETLRDELRRLSDPGPLRLHLAEFTARLHGLGIYFAAGHIGNYLVRPNGGLGLIDVHDLWIGLGSLGPFHRGRSFRILLKYPEDRELLGGDERLSEFVQAYLEASQLTAGGQRRFLKRLPIELAGVTLRAGRGSGSRTRT